MTAAASNWRVGLPLAVLTSMLWAIVPPVMKGLLTHLDPITLVWCRQVGCGVLIVGYFAFRRGVSWAALRERDVLLLVAICALGLTVNALLLFIGLQYATPSATQVLGQLGPVLVLLGAVFIFKESFTRQQWFGAAVVISGLVIFFHDHLVDIVRMSHYGYGMLILAIAPIFWASYALAQKRLAGRLGTQQVLMIAYVLGTFALLPLSSPARVAALDAIALLLLVIIIAVYIVSYLALGTAMLHWEASRVSAMITLTPLFTLVFTHLIAVIFPGYLQPEDHDLLSWGGAALVVGGSFLAAMPRRSYRPRTA
ncbi:MAG: DMT family transporter [Spongiibacteraceae bacterium]